MKIIYPAVFHEENGSFWVEFPDIEGCFSDGEDIADVLKNAQEALALHCESVIESGGFLPKATSVKNIEKPEDGWVSLVESELVIRSKSVKKTLTIPAWLNELAEANGVNFSSTLQNALLRELNITGSI